MKNNKGFILLEAALAVLAIILATLMLTLNPSPTLGKVAVIIPDADNSQWASLKYGLKMAAADYNVEMFVVDTGETLDVKEQETLIEQELANGADAIIVQPAAGKSAGTMLKKFAKSVPVLLIADTAVGEASLVSVKSDNYALGQKLAQEVLRDYSGSLADKTLGLLAENDSTQAEKDRRQGLVDGLQSKGLNITWSVAGAYGVGKEKSLEALPKVNIVLALDNNSVVAAGQAASTNDLKGAIVYGIGHSTEAITYLDKDYVACLVVPDEFSVGYQSLVKTAKRLQHSFWKNKNEDVSYQVIRRDELFLKENQDLLFMMNQ